MWLLDSRIGKSIVLILVGFFLYLYLGDESMISSKTVGLVIIVLATLNIVLELQIKYSVKKSKKSKQIGDEAHSKIAHYFENNKIKYVYKPKDEKDIDFYLPEYDVYVKYWKEHSDKTHRDKLTKRTKKYELKLLEIYYDKLTSKGLLHASFMKRLSTLTRKR